MTLFADLGAEKTIGAEKADEKIAVEIKVFGSRSVFDDLEKAFGQYQVYRSFLRKIEPERKVFLAVSSETYNKIFTRTSVKFLLADLNIQLFVFEPKEEEIIEWIR